MVVQCQLCPKLCMIANGQTGECRIRANIDDELVALTYGFPVALNLDPVEKKPLYHFYPSSKVLSVATTGCNLHCKNCQNWEISQANPEDIDAYYLPPEILISKTRKMKVFSIAYTYTEPAVFYEYTLQCSILAKENKIKNIIVSAGYINEKPLKKLLPFINAANIDLKAFSNQFYQDICEGSLRPVLRCLELCKKYDVMLEITNLIIPTLNDSDKMIKDLVSWIKKNLGKETPLHFSRFHPQYKMKHLPVTPFKTLNNARDIALSLGMQFVYIGNVSTKSGANTYCPFCKQLLIERKRYSVSVKAIKNGYCLNCNKEINGIWS